MSSISFAQLCNTPAVREAEARATDPQVFRAELQQASFFSDIATRNRAAGTEHRFCNQEFARAGIHLVNPAIR